MISCRFPQNINYEYIFYGRYFTFHFQGFLKFAFLKKAPKIKKVYQSKRNINTNMNIIIGAVPISKL